MKGLKNLSKKIKDKIESGDIQQTITENVNIESMVHAGDKLKEKIDASGITEKARGATEKAKSSSASVVGGIQKGISKISLGEKSILVFSRTCSEQYIEIGKTATVTIKLKSRYETGVLDCIVTDEVPPQFELIGEMPLMEYQLNPNEEKEYQYKIQANVGGHFRTRAICEIENKFSLDDIPSNEMEIYVSPLGIRMTELEMLQDQWKEIGFIFENLSDKVMTNLDVSLKKGSKFDMDSVPTCDETLAKDQCVMIPRVLKTQESGSVSLDLVVACTDENGEKYTTEKNFLVQVAESDKTVAKVNIGDIGKIVSSGATNIEGDVVAPRGVIGGTAVKGGGSDEVLYEGSRSVEVSGSIVQRSEMDAETDDAGSEPEKTCLKCGNAVQVGWKMCPFCGTELELKCPNCDHGVEGGWKMCPFCGGKLK